MGETAGEKVSDDHPLPCPICGQGCEQTAELRTHLMVSHRKSAVTDELLSTTVSGSN